MLVEEACCCGDYCGCFTPPYPREPVFFVVLTFEGQDHAFFKLWGKLENLFHLGEGYEVSEGTEDVYIVQMNGSALDVIGGQFQIGMRIKKGQKARILVQWAPLGDDPPNDVLGPDDFDALTGFDGALLECTAQSNVYSWKVLESSGDFDTLSTGGPNLPDSTWENITVEAVTHRWQPPLPSAAIQQVDDYLETIPKKSDYCELTCQGDFETNGLRSPHVFIGGFGNGPAIEVIVEGRRQTFVIPFVSHNKDKGFDIQRFDMNSSQGLWGFFGIENFVDRPCGNDGIFDYYETPDVAGDFERVQFSLESGDRQSCGIFVIQEWRRLSGTGRGGICPGPATLDHIHSVGTYWYVWSCHPIEEWVLIGVKKDPAHPEIEGRMTDAGSGGSTIFDGGRQLGGPRRFGT